MCLYPKLIRNPKYRANKKNGGQTPVPIDGRAQFVPIGCGMCMECRKQKTNEWKLRLTEDIKEHKNGKFITLTFSEESYIELMQEIQTGLKKEITGYALDNAIATKAVRRYLERYRKEHGKSLRHWLITELGGNNTERIHLHGIIWTDNVDKAVSHWHYGYTWTGKKVNEQRVNYVNEQTINYITKYMTKTDLKHQYYKPVILTSPGIGANYANSYNFKKRNYFNGDQTKDTYKTSSGKEVALPLYWRNKAYDEEEREQLWMVKLDKKERWINGEKIDISTPEGEAKYEKLLKWHQQKNVQLGYGSPTNWEAKQYEEERRMLKQEEKLANKKNKS